MGCLWPTGVVPVGREDAKYGLPVISTSASLLAGLLTYAALGMLSRQDFSRWVALPAIFDERVAALVYPVNLVLGPEDPGTPTKQRAGCVRRAQPRDGSFDSPIARICGWRVGAARPPRPLWLSSRHHPWLTAHRAEWLAYTDVRSTAQWTAVAVPQLVTRAVPGGGRASRCGPFAKLAIRRPDFQSGTDIRRPQCRCSPVLDRGRGVLLPQGSCAAAGVRASSGKGARANAWCSTCTAVIFPCGRYEPRFRRFTPTLRDTDVEGHPGPACKQQAINDYDNTLLALDDFCSDSSAFCD